MDAQQDNISGTTTDALLGGRVRLLQPQNGYRAAIDPVLLAAAVPAKTGHRILELGAGTGAAALCLNARIMGISGALLERDADMLALLEANVIENAAPLAVVAGAVGDAEWPLGVQEYDHVFCNPPYYGDDYDASPHATRNAAHAENTPLAAWVGAARRALKPNGMLTCILPPARMAEWLAALDAFGAIEIIPIAPKEGTDAKRVIIRAIIGRKTPLVLHAPFVLHKADGIYSDEAEAVLRNGAPLA